MFSFDFLKVRLSEVTIYRPVRRRTVEPTGGSNPQLKPKEKNFVDVFVLSTSSAMNIGRRYLLGTTHKFLPAELN